MNVNTFDTSAAVTAKDISKINSTNTFSSCTKAVYLEELFNVIYCVDRGLAL